MSHAANVLAFTSTEVDRNKHLPSTQVPTRYSPASSGLFIPPPPHLLGWRRPTLFQHRLRLHCAYPLIPRQSALADNRRHPLLHESHTRGGGAVSQRMPSEHVWSFRLYTAQREATIIRTRLRQRRHLSRTATIVRLNHPPSQGSRAPARRDASFRRLIILAWPGLATSRFGHSQTVSIARDWRLLCSPAVGPPSHMCSLQNEHPGHHV